MKKTVKESKLSNVKKVALVAMTLLAVSSYLAMFSGTTKTDEPMRECPSNYPTEIERERVRLNNYQYYLLHTEEVGYVDNTAGYTLTKLSVNEEEGYFTVLVEGVKEEPYEWQYTLFSDEEAQERLEIARAEYENAKRELEEWKTTDEYKEYAELCGLN